MDFSFDMHRIGRTIAQLRHEHNMTQMQLADEMNVSFQAVSNWERGQSMPDISKLPELSELFGVTIDHLLGRTSALAEKAALGKLEELPSITVEELVSTAPILPPRQIESLTDTLLAQEHHLDVSALLPFLAAKKVDEIALSQAAEGKSIMELAPFMSEDTIDHLVRQYESQGKSIVHLAPFAYEDTIDEIAQARNDAGKNFTELLPFISEDSINQIFLDRLRRNESIHHLLPFIAQDTIHLLYEAATKK